MSSFLQRADGLGTRMARTGSFLVIRGSVNRLTTEDHVKEP